MITADQVSFITVSFSGKWKSSLTPEGYCPKPIHFEECTDKNIWLFNITADPTEQYDLSQSHPGIVRQLLDRLKYYHSTSVECVYPESDKMAYPEFNGGAWIPWK